MRPFTRSLPSRRLFAQAAARFSTARPTYCPNRADLPANNDPAAPNQPHVSNTTSTLTGDFPSVGKKPAPPEFIGTVAPKHGQTGGAGQVSGAGTYREDGNGGDAVDASQSEWARFIAEPIKRVGEDESTTRARLLYQSRKRGILETDLLLSTFADERLKNMSAEQMREYDAFLDENDWDIYYWCTQDPPAPPLPGSAAGGSSSSAATATTQSTVHNSATSRRTASEVHPNGKIFPPPGAQHLGSIEQPMVVGAEDGSAKSIEWAQTVGSVKVAYRPVPQRWKDSWVLGALREHVEGRRARTGQEGTGKKRGMGRMPDLSG